MTDEQEKPRGWGTVYAIMAVFAGLTALVATAGVINVLAGGKWGVRIYGAEVDLPRHWEVVVPLYVVAGFVFLLGWMFGNLYVLKDKIKKHPLQVIAGTLLAVTVIVTSYTFWVRYSMEGGKLFWAIENDRMDIFKEALEAGPTEEELFEAAYDAARDDRVGMLRLLLDKDIPVDINTEERKRCLLSSCVGAGLEAVRLCIEKGSRVENCYEGSRILGRMIDYRERFGYSNADLLEGARLLVEAGADPHWDAQNADSAYLISRREKLTELIEYFASIKPQK
jgi:hypothetical protein